MPERVPNRITFEDVCRENGVRAALMQLLEAFDYAADTGREAWDFAVELATVCSTGATVTDLRWLTRCGYIVHAEETTPRSQSKRTFRAEGELTFSRRSCLVLSPEGAAATRACPADSPARPELDEHETDAYAASGRDRAVTPDGCVPRWDPELRELRWQGVVVKRFRVPSANQELVLTVFEEEGWPRHIDDPLPPGKDKRAQHLRDAIRRLNQRHINHLLRFKADGRGQGVCWEPSPTDRSREKETE